MPQTLTSLCMSQRIISFEVLPHGKAIVFSLATEGFPGPVFLDALLWGEQKLEYCHWT